MFTKFGIAVVAAAFVPAHAVQPPQAAAGAVPGPVLEAAALQVDEYFRKLSEAGSFSGAVMVAMDGRVLLARGYGFANRETNEGNTADTLFNLASVNKFITRLAIYQLVDAGKLSLEDRVGKILPDYPNVAVREKVTVLHLLEMKSGIPDFFNEAYEARRTQLHTTDDFLALFANESLKFEPGEKTQYSNGGYVLLGKIIEQVSGLPYDQYVQRHIAAPAGMRSTLLDRPKGTRGLAVGYTRASTLQGKPPAEGPLRSNHNLLAPSGNPAGGGYSTVRDFARLDAALRSGLLLKPVAFDRFFGPDFRNQTGKGTGWIGGFPGANTGFSMLPNGLTLAIFANLDPPAASRAAKGAFDILREAIEPHLQAKSK